MSIFNFIKKLLPRIERSTVAEDLRTTEKECVNAVLPSWEAASVYFKINKPGSQEVAALQQIFVHNFQDSKKAMRSSSFILDIARLIPNLHDNILVLQSSLDQYLEKDILSEGLTVRSAFVLRAASNVSMVTRYLLALLNYIHTVEAAHFDTEVEPGLQIAKAELRYVESNFARFVSLFSEYSIPSADFKKIIGEAPEVFANSRTQGAVQGMFNGGAGDPFESYGVSGFVGNPIYRIRLMVAKWQNDRYLSAKDKKQQLELRLLYLQMQKDGNKDPSVVSQIEHLQKRIEDYDQYLREVEENITKDE